MKLLGNSCHRDLNHNQHGRLRSFFPLLLLLILTAACTGGKKETPKPKPAMPVTVAMSVRKGVPVQIRAIGNVEPFNVVAIKAQVNGQIARVHFREGQDVRKGDLLFSIDPRPFEATLRQAEATLAKDLAQAKFAREQARRYESLLKDGIVTQDQYDQLRANVDAFEASIASDRAAIDNARLQLGYCSIRSPLDGRTGNLMVQEGNLVKANDNPVLVVINQIDPIYTTFSVPERDMVEIRKYLGKGIKIDAFVNGDESKSETGIISFLDNAVDVATGTIKLKGTFANKERRLWPGQFVNVLTTLNVLSNAVVIPTQAIQTGQQGQYVFVVKSDKTVELRPVVVGIAFNGESVIDKGMQPDEMVVIDGQVRLVPGAKVELKQPVSTKNANSSSPAIPAKAPAIGPGKSQ